LLKGKNYSWCHPLMLIKIIDKKGVDFMSNYNIRTTLRIPKDLKERVKLLARKNHISMNEQFIEMLESAYMQYIVIINNKIERNDEHEKNYITNR
ncbi:MAG: Arc family DNA-binding protein, partial [Bacilli bacterium]|nr:Arc family DNA-binding protein [Bacilli bacterium]